jgi:hypothetical protein
MVHYVFLRHVHIKFMITSGLTVIFDPVCTRLHIQVRELS